jgi:multiple sugar transport system substrate-binding protein
LKTAEYTPGSLSQCRYDGRLYAIPYLLDCMVLLYNKDVFRDAGLDPDRPPRTLEELESYCRRITLWGPDGRVRRIGLRPPEAVMLLAVFGGGFVDERTGRITADNPRNVAAAGFYKRLMDAQGGNEAVEAFSQGFANDMGTYNPFFLGQVGMIFSGQWNSFWIYRYRPAVRCGTASRLCRIPPGTPSAQALSGWAAISSAFPAARVTPRRPGASSNGRRRPRVSAYSPGR